MSVEHTLKCWPQYFDAISRGEKTFEVRRNDRGFQKGDTLVLRRYDIGHGYFTPPGKTFGFHELRREISYVLTGGQFGIEPGFVVLSLAQSEDASRKRGG